MSHPIADKLDLANHHSNATVEDVQKLCKNVLDYGFNAAFVNPVHVALAHSLVAGKAKVGTVISFPLGQDTLAIKQAAIKDAVAAGADELDVVPNLGFLVEDPQGTTFGEEMKVLVATLRETADGKIIKFILETGYMSAEQITLGATLIKAAGADFVKLCSGMGPRGASVEDVRIVKAAIGSEFPVKAAGGIDTMEEVQAFLAAGVARMGTSKGVEIITGLTPATPASAGKTTE